jgi:hypothetical protein
LDHPFHFDPALPDLPVAFDPGAVTRLFAAHGSGGATLRAGRLQDVKYQPGARCVATYELLVDQGGVPPRPTIGVVEITPGGPAARLFVDDPALPWLAPAMDPAGMRARFAALPADGADGQAITACTITPIRYKPGARCVFRYDLETPGGPRSFFGKLLARDGDRLMATVAALHDLSRRVPALPRIPAPVAYWPEVHLLVQPAVTGGAELNTLAFDPAADMVTRDQWLRDAGARLAALQAYVTVAAPRRTIADDLAELREYVAPMTQAQPAPAARYVAVLGEVAARAAAQADGAAVAAHGAFRTDQFMIQDGDLVMIDLDGFCWADPARDAGNFLAYLRWKAIRRPEQAAFIAHAGQIFLAGYQAAGGAADPARRALYEAASLLKIAGRRFRSLTVKEWPLVPQLLDAARAVLDQPVSS